MPLPKGAQLYEAQATYTQKQDNCGPTGGNEITLKAVNGDGHGHYYVLQSRRWAFDDAAELVALVKDFMRRVKA